MFVLPAAVLTLATVFTLISALSFRAAPGGVEARSRRFAAVVYVLFIPAFSISLYLWLGRPQMPDQAYADRAAASAATQAGFLASLQAHLQKTPDDTRGWIVLARAFRSRNALDDAIAAYRRADKGNFAAMAQLGIADALIEKNDKVALGEAKTLLEAFLAKTPGNLDGKFLLARAKARMGDTTGAIGDFSAIRDGLPGADPLRPTLQREIDLVKSQNGAKP